MLKTYDKNEKNVVFLQKAEVNKKNRTLAFWFNVLPNIFLYSRCIVTLFFRGYRFIKL